MLTCGYAPKRHPHTSRIALSYLTLSRVEAPPSSVQQASQSAITAPSSNCLRSWQEEHSSFAELNPRSRHLDDLYKITSEQCLSNGITTEYFREESVDKLFTLQHQQPQRQQPRQVLQVLQGIVALEARAGAASPPLRGCCTQPML